MAVKSHNFQKLLQRELTRKEFLQVVGLMLLSIVGISGLLANVNKSLDTSGKKETDYSEGSYG